MSRKLVNMQATEESRAMLRHLATHWQCTLPQALYTALADYVETNYPGFLVEPIVEETGE